MVWVPNVTIVGVRMTSSPSPLQYELTPGVTLILFNDAKADAVTSALVRQLREALVSEEAEAHALVLAGRPGWFCAGRHRRYFERYLAAGDGVDAEQRLRPIHEARRGIASAEAARMDMTTLRAEGSVEDMRCMVELEAPIDAYRAFARRMAGVAANSGGAGQDAVIKAPAPDARPQAEKAGTA